MPPSKIGELQAAAFKAAILKQLPAGVRALGGLEWRQGTGQPCVRRSLAASQQGLPAIERNAQLPHSDCPCPCSGAGVYFTTMITQGVSYRYGNHWRANAAPVSRERCKGLGGLATLHVARHLHAQPLLCHAHLPC